MKIKYNFKGKNITTDGGAILLEKYMEKIGFKSSLEVFNSNQIDESKRGPKEEYNRSDILYQQIIGYMKGYANPTEISRTKLDTMNTLVFGTQIASQSTFSRLNTNFDKSDDSTNIATHGEQEGGEYIHHYLFSLITL